MASRFPGSPGLLFQETSSVGYDYNSDTESLGLDSKFFRVLVDLHGCPGFTLDLCIKPPKIRVVVWCL